MGQYSLQTNRPFQFLEIGFYDGAGDYTYREFLQNTTEVHLMEISCLPEGKVEDGKVGTTSGAWCQLPAAQTLVAADISANISAMLNPLCHQTNTHLNHLSPPPPPAFFSLQLGGNFAVHNKNYQKYLDEDRLHCGDASNFVFLQNIWTTKMRRPGAPPLRIVVDDGSHLAWHMAQSVIPCGFPAALKLVAC
jgi:hypothetical protein